MPKTCDHTDCENPIWSKNYCKWHQYLRGDKKPLKRTPIKKISDKRKAQVEVYSVLRKTFLKQNPMCAVFPHLKAVEIHHINHKEVERLNDTKYWLAVSRKGHVKIHEFPEESYLKKWLIKG